MTKSQNTKNEQQKDLCITSEQLTEQWKKGELPNGWYWVKGSRTKGIYAYTAEYLNNTYRPINGESVLEKVPDYDYWQNLWNTADMEHKANNKLLEDVERLEKENKELKKQVNHLSKTQARQFVDNQKFQVKAEKAKDVVDIEAARKIKELERNWFGNYGFESFELHNNLVNIKRLEDQVKTIDCCREKSGLNFEFAGGKVEYDAEEIRYNIFFDEKPDEIMRIKLKSHGFKWSPRRGAWTRGAKTITVETVKKILEA